MTDGLANEIEFGFECDARMRRARRIGYQPSGNGPRQVAVEPDALLRLSLLSRMSPVRTCPKRRVEHCDLSLRLSLTPRDSIQLAVTCHDVNHVLATRGSSGKQE